MRGMLTELLTLPAPEPGIVLRVGDPRLSLPRPLQRIALDPDRGLVLLSGGDIVVVRNLRRGTHVGLRTDGSQYHVATLVNGDVVLVDDDTVDRFDAVTDAPRADTVTRAGIVGAACDAEDRNLACLTSSSLALHDARTLALLREIPIGEPGDAPLVALAPGGGLALVAGAALQLVDTTTGDVRWTRPRAEHATGAVFPSARELVLVERVAHRPAIDGAGWSTSLTVLDAATGAERASWRLDAAQQESRYPLAVSADGARVAVALEGSVEVWDLALMTRLSSTPCRAFALAFVDEDTLLAGAEHRLIAIEVGTGRSLLPEGPRGWVAELAWRPGFLFAGPDGLLVASDGAIRRLPCPGGRPTPSPDGERFACHEGDRLAIRSADGAVLHAIPDTPHVALIAWGGSTLVTYGWDGVLRVVDPDAGRVVAEAPAPASSIARLHVSDDGALLVVELYGSPPRLWGVPSLARRPALAWPGRAEVDGAALTRGGRELVVGTTDGKIHRFDTTSGALLGTVTTGAQRAQCVAVSPDGRLAAVGSNRDGVVRLVGLARGDLLGSWPVEQATTGALAFSPDGTRVAVGRSDATIVVLPVPASAADAPVPNAEPLSRKAQKPRRTAPALREIPPHPLPAPIGLGAVWMDAHRTFLVRGHLLGHLVAPSGKLVAGDPWSPREMRGFGHPVAPGRFPVWVVAEESDYPEPQGLYVQLESRDPVRWVRAGYAGTDSATIAIADHTVARRAQDDGPEGELLSNDVLRGELPPTGARLVGDSRGSIALVSTGSDGGFPVWWGHDRSGATVALLVEHCSLDWRRCRRAALPGGDPPWDAPATVVWAHAALRALGEPPGFDLAPLDAASLARLEARAGTAPPADVAAFYATAAPRGLAAWEALADALARTSAVGFPLDDVTERGAIAAVRRKGVWRIESIDGEGSSYARWLDTTGWLVHAVADASRASR